MTKLYRSKQNRMIAGVVGGLAEHWHTDATLLRLIWVLIVLLTGLFPGVIAYLIAILVMPEEPGVSASSSTPPPAEPPAPPINTPQM